MSNASGPNALARFAIGTYNATGRITVALATYDGSGIAIGTDVIEIARGADKVAYPGRLHELTIVWAVALATGTAADIIKLYESLDAGVTVRPIGFIVAPAHTVGPPVGGPPDVTPATAAPLYWLPSKFTEGRKFMLQDETHRIYAATHGGVDFDVHAKGLVY